MCAVHLGVVELKRQLQRCPKESLVVSPPDDKRIVENAAVHAHRASISVSTMAEVPITMLSIRSWLSQNSAT